MAQRFHSIRTIPKVVNYRNDGAGRDTYISFYNGGFGSYKLSDISPKERTESPKHYYHQNLALSKPAKRYFTDGGGRDLYVYNSLRDENDKCKGNLRLNNILRSYDNSKQYVRTSKNVSPSKFEKKLIDRIFYGKCPGLNDRLMSPKVKFLKKEDLRKSTEENMKSPRKNSISKKSDFFISIDHDKEKSKNKRLLPKIQILTTDENDKNRYDKYGVSITETGIKKNNTTGTDFNNSFFNTKRTPKKYKVEMGQNDNLVDSVKKIFLYNSKINKNKNLYNSIKMSDFMHSSYDKDLK